MPNGDFDKCSIFFSLRFLNVSSPHRGKGICVTDVGNWRHTGQCKSEKRDDDMYESTGCISEEHRKNGWMDEDEDEDEKHGGWTIDCGISKEARVIGKWNGVPTTTRMESPCEGRQRASKIDHLFRAILRAALTSGASVCNGSAIARNE